MTPLPAVINVIKYVGHIAVKEVGLRQRHVALYCSQDSDPRYVVAHALCAKRRGRRPSQPYKGVKNPRRALELARRELAGNNLEWMRRPISLRFICRDEREVRRWIHTIRGALKKRGVVINVPQPYTAADIDALLLTLCEWVVAFDMQVRRPPVRVQRVLAQVRRPTPPREVNELGLHPGPSQPTVAIGPMHAALLMP